MISGDSVIHEIDLPAPPDAVFDLFTDARRLTRWIGISADVDPRPGGLFRFEVAPGQFCEGEYVVVDRPRRLAFTWGWTDESMGLPPGGSLVDVCLQATPTGTRLRLVHDRLPGALRLLHDDGWTRFLGRLQAAAVGTEPGPYPNEHPDERRAALEGSGKEGQRG
jgi:uncharacterized protein YndB with AHSA1/START domain